MAASIPILRALARDKAGPKGVKLFTLNATEHVTLAQRPEAADSTPPEGENGPGNGVAGASRRLLTLVRKGRAGRAPVLSNIMETEELSPRVLGNNSTVERSFV